MRRQPKATAADYHRVFEGLPAGTAVLEDLVARFGRESYVSGGLEADRETCYRAGQRRVVSFILDQINRANSGEPPSTKEEASNG